MAVRLEADNIEELSEELKYFNYNPGQRVVRAFKIFGALFLAAIVSVFIPALHFVLVPLFLILSVFFAWGAYHQVAAIGLEGARCPKCKAELKEKRAYLKSTEARAKIRCFNCRSDVKISLKN